MITSEDYAYLQEKYGKLILKVANSLFGDLSKDEEDYASDIWFVVLDYLPKYVKKHNKSSIREFCEDPVFNGYVKQWIWTTRNNIGSNIAKKKHIINPSLRIDREHDEVRDMEIDMVSYQLQSQNEEIVPLILAELKEATNMKDRTLSSIAFDCDTIKENGHFNTTQIAKNLGIPYNSARHDIDLIRKEYKNGTKG